ncbi:MAG: uroporphyrinogen decarboxylase family protein [Anaerolineae bacterium]
MVSATTSRQRMLCAVHQGEPDRVPVAPWGLGRLDPLSATAAELIARTDPWIEVGLGCDPVGGAAFPLEERQMGSLRRRIVHTPRGDLTATWTTTAATTASTEHLCKSVADIEALLSIPYVAAHPDTAYFHARRRTLGEDGLVVMGLGDALCFPNDVLGTEYCSLLWAEQPDVIRSMVAVAAERIHRVIEEACLAGVDCFRIVGGEYATQLMGPAAWDALVVSYDRPLVELMHQHGAVAHYHNHGNMRRFLGRIADLGVDSLDPIEQPPYGDMAMRDAHNLIGARVCLVGGLDDMEVLETRPTAEVLRMGQELLEALPKRGFMLGGTSSGIYGEQAARHFIALADLAERMA